MMITRNKTGATVASLKRVGVMWHWRIGRLGGSLYLAKRKPAPVTAEIPLAAFIGGPWLRVDGGNGYRRRIAESLATGARMAFL